MALASFALLGFATVCAADYFLIGSGQCKLLEWRLHDPEVQQALEAWVARNWSGDRIPPESVLSGDGIVPGWRWLPASFDGSILAMGPNAHVRLLGVEAGDVLANEISPSVEAIYFTDRSRMGVFVQLEDRETLALPADDITRVSERVGVLCWW